MKVVTYSEARSALKTLLDRVHDDADVTVISRRDGADAVVMSLDHYQSIVETMHLLGTPANAAHLAKSIAQHKAGKAVRRDLLQTCLDRLKHGARHPLYACCVGRLPVLAGARQKDSQTSQHPDRRVGARAVYRHWQARALDGQLGRLLVTPN